MKKAALALALIICAIFSLLAIESQTIILVKGNATFHIGDIEIIAPKSRYLAYNSSTIILRYRATFHELKHKWIVYSLDGGENITVYDEYNDLQYYGGSVTLSGLSAGNHVIYIYSKKGTFAWGTSLKGGYFDAVDKTSFTIDLSGESSNPTPTITPTPKPTATPEPTPTLAPTSTPTGTPEPTVTPYGEADVQNTSQYLSSGGKVAVTVAVVVVGLGLLVYLIKRK